MADIVNTNRQLRMKLVSAEAKLEDMSKELSTFISSIQSKTEQSLTSSTSSTTSYEDGKAWLETGNPCAKTLDEWRDYEITVLRSNNSRLLELLELFAGMKEIPLKGSRNVCL